MADARAVNFTPQDIAPLLQVPPGAAGTAQQAEIVTPPGFGSYQSPWAGALEGIFGNLQQQAAQQKTQQQYAQAVQGIGEFWPQLQSMGMTEGQVNSLLKSGMSPEQIMHSAFTDEASRHMKMFDWLREDYTHARGLSESAFTPDQLDVVDQYRQGKISLPDAMRQSSLSPTQLKSALGEMTVGQTLQGTMTANEQKKVLLKKDELELADLPDKLKSEGKKRMLELQDLQFKVDHAQTEEDRKDAKQSLDEARFRFEKWKAENKPASTKTLPPELQTQANTLKGLATPQAMYAQGRKQGLNVRPPGKAPVSELTGLPTGKPETKDAYYKDVILPALQNKNISSPKTENSQSFVYPKTPVGQAAEKAANEFGIDAGIFGRLIRQESHFQDLTSKVGARGPAQLMPDTARGLGVKINNPIENVRGGAKYLSQLLKEFGGDYTKAVAAYNAGSDAVKKYNGVPPFPETQAYVRAILGTDQMTPVSKSVPRQRKPLDQIL